MASRLNPLTGYMALLERFPIPTKVCTATLLSGVGDAIAQVYIEGHERVDEARSAKFAMLGGVTVAPLLHFWYGLLNRAIPGTTFGCVVRRVMADQLLFTPVLIPVMFFYLKSFEGTPELTLPLLKQEYTTTLLTNWAVWTPAQLINFRFVPLKLQVLFANLVSVGWSASLSYRTHREVDSHTVPAARGGEEEASPRGERVGVE